MQVDAFARSSGEKLIEADPLVGRVIEIIAVTQELDPEKITMESTFEELGVDSLTGLNILSELEDEFRISIPDDQAREISTVRQIVESLRPVVAQASGRDV